MQAAARDFLQRHGCPDIVIANAGVSAGTLSECADDLPAFRDTIDINLIGMLQTFQPFIAVMRAARSIAGIIRRGKTFAVIPWQMAIIARVLRVLPNWLYDRVFGRAPRKPRRSRE